MGEIQSDLREKHIIGSRTAERIVSARLCPGLTRRGIQTAGVSDSRWPFAFRRADPAFTQILVTLSGCGEALDGGRWVRCEVGTAYLTPPGTPHAYHAMPDGTAWEIAWVQYPLRPPHGSVRGVSAPAPLSGLPRPLVTRVDPAPLAVTIRGLYDECIADTPDATVIEDWISLLHAQALRLARAADSDDRLRRLWSEVTADLSHPWTIDTLAQRAEMSGEQLRRLCNHELQRSPMRHVTYLRMRHAASLLASGFYTVEAAARSVGYDNPFAFSTAFRRCLGATPSSYRNGAADGNVPHAAPYRSDTMEHHGHASP